MEIWILNHYAISPAFSGGSRHFDLAQQLVGKGHKVRIFASSFNHFEKKETVNFRGSNYKNEEVSGVSFTWIKTHPYKSGVQRVRNILDYSLKLNKILKKELRDKEPTLIIGSSVHPLTPLVGIRRAKQSGILFYFEERDLWPQTFVDFGLIKEKNMLAQILYKIEHYLYKKSDRVIFLFDRAHLYAESKGLEKNKHIFLPNGFNPKRYLSEGIELNRDLKSLVLKMKDKKLCVYTGSMGEANHMFPLLYLAKEMKDKSYHFLFVGNGNNKDDLMRYVEEENLKNVSFFDAIPKSQIPDLLSYADYGLISMKDSPLYKWGFSMNKIYDYLAAGLPIIMYSNVENLGPLESNTAIIKSNSIPQLKKILLSEIKMNKEQIMNDAYNKYSWDVLSKNLLHQIETDRKIRINKAK